MEVEVYLGWQTNELLRFIEGVLRRGKYLDSVLLAFCVPGFEFYVLQEIVVHKESYRLRQVRDRVPDLW